MQWRHWSRKKFAWRVMFYRSVQTEQPKWLLLPWRHAKRRGKKFQVQAVIRKSSTTFFLRVFFSVHLSIFLGPKRTKDRMPSPSNFEGFQTHLLFGTKQGIEDTQVSGVTVQCFLVSLDRFSFWTRSITQRFLLSLHEDQVCVSRLVFHQNNALRDKTNEGKILSWSSLSFVLPFCWTSCLVKHVLSL